MPRVRVVIVEPDSQRRERLVACLSHDATSVLVVAFGTDISESIQHPSGQPKFDVLVANIDRSDLASLRAWMEIRVRFRGVRIVALTRGDDEMLEAALGAGVASLHPVDVSCEALLRAIQRAYRGSVDYDPAILERASKLLLQPATGSLVRVGGLALDLERKTVSRWGKRIQLSPLEYDLLAFLAKQPGVPASAPELLELVWRMPDARDGTPAQVKNCVLRLRKKVEPVPQHPRYILSDRGRGYYLSDPIEDAN